MGRTVIDAPIKRYVFRSFTTAHPQHTQSCGLDGRDNSTTLSVVVNPYLAGAPVSGINSGFKSPSSVKYFTPINSWWYLRNFLMIGVSTLSMSAMLIRMHNPNGISSMKSLDLTFGITFPSSVGCGTHGTAHPEYPLLEQKICFREERSLTSSPYCSTILCPKSFTGLKSRSGYFFTRAFLMACNSSEISCRHFAEKSSTSSYKNGMSLEFNPDFPSHFKRPSSWEKIP
mmetsp:Transcript_456/g.1742  ORF Transcript_456/g.1742 Transcript_456/m.1742 type:complete len:229 (+) Transcript_456:2934-3620(+)